MADRKMAGQKNGGQKNGGQKNGGHFLPVRHFSVWPVSVTETTIKSMRKRLTLQIILVAILVWLPTSQAPTAIAPEPIVYTLRFPSPDTHLAEVEAVIPTRRRASIELMMPIWSPGFYRVENYAGRIQSLSARASDGNISKWNSPERIAG